MCGNAQVQQPLPCLHHALEVFRLACMAGCRPQQLRQGAMFSSAYYWPASMRLRGCKPSQRGPRALHRETQTGPHMKPRTLERVVAATDKHARVVDQAGDAHARQLVGQRLAGGGGRHLARWAVPLAFCSQGCKGNCAFDGRCHAGQCHQPGCPHNGSTHLHCLGVGQVAGVCLHILGSSRFGLVRSLQGMAAGQSDAAAAAKEAAVVAQQNLPPAPSCAAALGPPNPNPPAPHSPS